MPLPIDLPRTMGKSWPKWSDVDWEHSHGLPDEDTSIELADPNKAYVRSRLNELLALPSDWDSYGAKPIDPNIAETADMLLGTIMVADSPKPSIVPVNHGGIQLEWHSDGVDFEIEIASPNEFEVYWHDRLTGEEWERVVAHDWQLLDDALRELTRRRIGVEHRG